MDPYKPVGVPQQADPWAGGAAVQMSPRVAPQQQASAYQEGQSGIQFGGGKFQWTQHPDGTWGWVDPTSSRTFDPYGNPRPATPAPQPNPALAQQQAQAQPLVDFFRNRGPVGVNTYQFNRLNSSTQQLALGAAEAAGYDKQDAYEQIQRLLPTATGPKRGYVAPLGAR